MEDNKKPALCGWYNTASQYCSKMGTHPTCLGDVRVCTIKGSEVTDNVNHPKHYNQGKFEVIDVISDWKLDFCLGNAVKYIARCNHKSNKIEDIKKAIWYLEREIQETEKRG